MNTLAGLASRLTNPEDRETYASLISYFESLPEEDELCRLAQLLGFVSLLGQQIPHAVTDFLTEFRAQTNTSAEYHTRLEQRLAALPAEIATGLDTSAIAESFRQQLAATMLHETAALLNGSVAEIKNLTAQITTALKPVPQQYKGIGVTISADLARLEAACTKLQEHNVRLVLQQERGSWKWQILVLVGLFLLGVLYGRYVS